MTDDFRSDFVPLTPTGRNEPGGPFATLSPLTSEWVWRDEAGQLWLDLDRAGDNAFRDEAGQLRIRG